MKVISDISKFKVSFTKFLNKGYEIYPIHIVGVKCNWNNFFITWLFLQAIKLDLDEEWIKSNHIDDLFQKIVKSKKANDNLIWLSGVETLLGEGNEVYVGVELFTVNKALSMNRILIDVRKELELIEFINEDDDPDIVMLHSDMYIIKSEEKGVTDGRLVREANENERDGKLPIKSERKEIDPQ